MPATLHAVCIHCNAVNRIPTERVNKAINGGKCHRSLFGSDPISVVQTAFEARISKSVLVSSSPPTHTLSRFLSLSQQMTVLRAEGLVKPRRTGVRYSGSTPRCTNSRVYFRRSCSSSPDRFISAIVA